MSKNLEQADGNQKVKVTIKSISPLFIKRTEPEITTCTLCRNSLDEVCNFCLEKRITDTDECPIVEGKCGHVFHLHCICEWLKRNNICPAHGCNQIWENA